MKSILLGLFSLALISSLHGQNYFEECRDDSTLNFYTRLEKLDSIYDSNDSFRINKSHGYKDFMRWKHFWFPRVDSTGEMKSYLTSYEKSFDAIEAYNSAQSSSKSGGWCTNGYTANWQPLGFTEKPKEINELPGASTININGMGWVSALWVNPSNRNHILCGGNGSGLLNY